MNHFWKAVFALTLLLFVLAMFFLALQIGRVADSNERLADEIRHTRILCDGVIRNPEIVRKLTQGY